MSDAAQIKKTIEKEISESTIDNWHGITKDNIKEHLVGPILEKYIDSMDENHIRELWTVLEEEPKTKAAYTIYFDPDEKEFGLGLNTKDNTKVFLGIYGSFITTLNAM